MSSLCRLMVSASLLTAVSLAAPAAATVGLATGSTEVTVVHGKCVGQGRMVVEVDRHPDGSYEFDLRATGLVAGSHWDGGISFLGWGDSFTGATADDGVITDSGSGSVAPSPMIVDAHIVSSDTDGECRVKVQPAAASAMTLCRLPDRKVNVSAAETVDSFVLRSHLAQVAPRSAWSVAASLLDVAAQTTQHTSVDRDASTTGVVRINHAFDPVAAHSLRIEYANAAGQGCGVTVDTSGTV